MTLAVLTSVTRCYSKSATNTSREAQEGAACNSSPNARARTLAVRRLWEHALKERIHLPLAWRTMAAGAAVAHRADSVG